MQLTSLVSGQEIAYEQAWKLLGWSIINGLPCSAVEGTWGIPADSGNFLQGMTNDVAILLDSYSKIVMLVVVYSQD